MTRTIAVLLVLGCAVYALSSTRVRHVRLIHPVNQTPLFWTSPSNISITINSAGSDDIADGSEEVALRMAVEEWNAATGTSATLVEDTTPAQQARTDWQAGNIHLIYFDENNSSSFFPMGSSTVAITPVFFQGGGNIVDADILFNGLGWNFTNTGEVGRFDVGDVGAHELGHLLGLNHSAFVGSSLYPYVDPTVLLHRSISEDDVHGLRDAYPSGSYGIISGTVLRQSNLFAVAGAYVVATDASTGRTSASILTDTSGNFTLPGMDPGTYEVYAVPLGSPGGFGDAPVDINNLGGGYFIETDFEPAVYGSQATISTNETVALGTLLVGADVAVNLGTSSDRFPLRVTAGASTNLVLHGTGLFGSPVEFSCSDPDVILSAPTYFGSQVNFLVTVPMGEALGHLDMTYINSSGDLAILPAGLEITNPTPTVTNCVPSSGARAGGTALTITGTNFSAGNRIVIGDQIYTDGFNGTTVVDSSTITLTTEATVDGTHDVAVFDESGLDGRLSNGFTAQLAPTIAAVFPPSGAFTGGTTVTLTGADLLTGAVVRIDGVTQGAVNYVDSTRVSFTTSGGAAGGPYVLQVENPDLALATSTFTYSAGPDPVITGVAPATGAAVGGDDVTITGANFVDGLTTAIFGADPFTGFGGTVAANVTFVDADTISAVTPVHSGGLVSVMVQDMATGQAAALPDAFTFEAEPPLAAGFFAIPTSGPFPLTAVFFDESTGGATSWFWDFGDGINSSLQAPVHTYASIGTYTVSLTASDGIEADTLTKSGYIVVTVQPPATAFTATPTMGIAPLTVAFTDQTTGDVTGRAWDFGDGSSSTQLNPNYTYSFPGTYSVTLIASGPGGDGIDHQEGLIQVEAPPPPVADFDASITQGFTPLNVEFTDLSTGAFYAWLWDFGDGETSPMQDPAHVYMDPGVYRVTLSTIGFGGVDTRTGYIVVFPTIGPIGRKGAPSASAEVEVDAEASFPD